MVLCHLGLTALASYAATDAKLISEQDAIKAALAKIGVEVLGIRFDEPDTHRCLVRQGTRHSR